MGNKVTKVNFNDEEGEKRLGTGNEWREEVRDLLTCYSSLPPALLLHVVFSLSLQHSPHRPRTEAAKRREHSMKRGSGVRFDVDVTGGKMLANEVVRRMMRAKGVKRCHINGRMWYK